MYFIKMNINSFIFPYDLFSNSRNRHLLRFIENIIIILRYFSRMFREFFSVISLLMATVRLWPHLDNLSFSKLVVSLLKDHSDLFKIITIGFWYDISQCQLPLQYIQYYSLICIYSSANCDARHEPQNCTMTPL